jgi:serralysin
MWQETYMTTSGSNLEFYMLDLINEERAANGLAPLKLEQNLNQSAEDHSQWMIQADVFSHTGAGGSSATQRMEAANFDFSGSWRSGENIGYQSERGAAGLEDDVEGVHDALMLSTGHRANILNTNYDYIGIGIEYGEYKGYDVVMITQNFAATSGSVILDDRNGSTPPPVEDPGTFNGTSGNDVLTGTSADEELLGLEGKDTLIGAAGNDTLDGGQGNDRLRGGAGEDVLRGGNGLDRVEYVDADAGVRVDLRNPLRNTGEAAGDSFNSIEWLVGSSHADRLIGDDGNNQFWGTKGHDKIYGLAGNDTLRGGSGFDKLHGQAGDDVLYGNGGNDDFVFARGCGHDVVKDFQNNRDELDFTAFDFPDQSALFAKAAQVGNDVVFAFSDANTVTVENMTMDQLQDDVLI